MKNDYFHIGQYFINLFFDSCQKTLRVVMDCTLCFVYSYAEFFSFRSDIKPHILEYLLVVSGTVEIGMLFELLDTLFIFFFLQPQIFRQYL